MKIAIRKCRKIHFTYRYFCRICSSYARLVEITNELVQHVIIISNRLYHARVLLLDKAFALELTSLTDVACTRIYDRERYRVP